MKALLLFESRQVFRTTTGKTIVMEMDLYELPEETQFNEVSLQYKFSWIAFDQDNPRMRILFDCHVPKGPHFHIDNEKEGQPFVWYSISDAVRLFKEKVTERFGDLQEFSDDGGIK